VDAAESDRISERQKAASRARALKGVPKLQRQRAFGWKKDGITLESEEAELVRQAVRDLIGGASITNIRRSWEKAGILTAAGGKVWEWSVLQRVLVGWRTAGVRTYNRKPLYDADGKLVMGAWEPIITLAEREAALAMLGKRAIKKERKGRWLLTGIIRCGECGGKMYGQLDSGQKPNSYACNPGNGHVALASERLDMMVQYEVYAHVMNRAVAESRESDAARAAPPAPGDWRARLIESARLNGDDDDAHPNTDVSGYYDPTPDEDVPDRTSDEWIFGLF
jgi:site-specific DNA recombinase